jgi:signal peptidase II
MTRKAWLIFAMVLGLTAAADQGSKAWARSLPPGPQPVIHGYWDWQVSQNPGAAFSTVQSGGAAGRVVLSVLACAALVGIGVMVRRSAPGAWQKRTALALIAGGALGNLVDRVRDGTVTDFIAWRVGEHRWPVFNVADAALLAGVTILMITSWRSKPESRGTRGGGAMLTA